MGSEKILYGENCGYFVEYLMLREFLAIRYFDDNPNTNVKTIHTGIA